MTEYDADQLVRKIGDWVEEHEGIEVGTCFLFGPTRHERKKVFDEYCADVSTKFCAT
jgi:hypothetical protein